MEPWHKLATPRQEVREGRSFDPNEFAIHLEQVVSGRGPEDYRDPDALLKAETERSPDFLRLANALSALYPEGTEEKRLVQAMVHAAPR